MEINEALKEIYEKYSDNHNEVSAVITVVLSNDNYIYTEIKTENDEMLESINLLANGLLSDAETVKLADLLSDVKINSKKDYQKLYRLMKSKTRFDKYKNLHSLVNQMVKDKKNEIKRCEEEEFKSDYIN